MGMMPMRALTLVAGILAVVFLGGCATRLAPAPGTMQLPGEPGTAALAEAEGVRVVARVHAWRGYPAQLERHVTPVLVIVENQSPRRLQIRYEHFALVGADGRTFAAVPPFDIDGAVVEHVPAAFVAPPPFHFHPRFRGRALGWYPFAWDPFYWDRYATRWIDLPTGDMVQMALPETVVEPGGRVNGFVYFEEVPRRVEQVTFRADLVDAATGQRFGAVAIPFVAQ